MARYKVRLHFRVMNRGQLDVLDDLIFSDDAQQILGSNWKNIDGRSLIIDKTVNYSGFLFISPFLEIFEVIRSNLGECIAIGDYVEQGSGRMSSYVCEVGDLSESETSVSPKLAAADIKNIEAWLKARGKSTPQSVIATVKSFYGAEPQPTMHGPWSIEKEIELRHNVFSKASYDEISEIASAEVARMIQIFGSDDADMKKIFLAILLTAGRIGAANGRKANASEKKLMKSFINGLPESMLNGLIESIETNATNSDVEVIKNVVNLSPNLASSVLNLIFCFIYADGTCETKDKNNLNKIKEALSMPMSVIFMSMKFGEEIPFPPLDYAAYVSGVDNDTMAYMDDSNDFMSVNLGGQNTGIRMISADLSDDDDDDDSPVNINLNKSFEKSLDFISNGALSLPTYELGKSENINGLYFGVPDQCVSLSEFSSSNVTASALRSLKSKFLYLAVPQGSEKDADAYQDLPLSIHCKKSGLSENVSLLTSLWGKSERERKQTLIDLTSRQLNSNGLGGYPVTYKSIENKLAVLYAQIGKGDDAQFWCSYSVTVFYKNSSFSFMIYINAKKDEKTFAKLVDEWVATISTKKPTPKKTTSKPIAAITEPQVELSNEELDQKILDQLKNGAKYSSKELRDSDEYIESLSPQKLSAALRRMVQNASLIKVDENNDSYYYSTKALYDKTVKDFQNAKTVEKLEGLIKEFNLLGRYEDSKSYVERCREGIKEIKYDAANALMLNAKTANDYKKAADAFRALGTYRDSSENANVCDARKNDIENAAAYDAAIQKMNSSKTSRDMQKVVALFEALGSYQNAKQYASECKEKVKQLAEDERKQNVYTQALAKVASDDILVLSQAVSELETLTGWRDADIQAYKIRTRIADIEAEQERIRIETAKKNKKKKLIMGAVIAGIVLVITFIILLVTIIIPSSQYNKGMKYETQGKYKLAAEMYAKAGSYKDSENRLIEVTIKSVDDLTVGDTVYLGQYNGKQLVWTVIKTENGRAMLVLNEILLQKAYNDKSGGIDQGSERMHYNEWPKCSLRAWLNNDFYNASFSSQEKTIITKTQVSSAGEHKDEGVCTDYIYIMSGREMSSVYGSGWDSDYEIRNQTLWLRGSSGTNGMYAEALNSPSQYDLNSITSQYGVVPVLWVGNP